MPRIIVTADHDAAAQPPVLLDEVSEPGQGGGFPVAAALAAHPTARPTMAWASRTMASRWSWLRKLSA